MTRAATAIATDIEALLACPRCGTGLEALRCRACRIEFPVHGGVPWLFADPGAAVSEWQNRWLLAVERLRADARAVTTALGQSPADAVRRRLEALDHGYAVQQACLNELLEPLKLAGRGSLETLLALRTRLPAAQGIFSYDANAHRDWGWGTDECRLACEAILEALAGSQPQRVLVLGAGAGRLAYDLHQRLAPALTVAVDLNPLLTYIGYRASRGETASLVEFPLAPRNPESAAVVRSLQAPEPSREALYFALADVLRPPFLGGAFDLVVTPWLLDVVDERPDRMLARINGLLADDGTWINQGSVAFAHPDPRWRLTLEELLELIAMTGFADVAVSEATVPYMSSPDSRHGRMERVATSRARKCAAVADPGRHDSLPPWIAQGRGAIPLLPSFQTQAMTTRMHAFIMSLIDGKRSLKDIARVLEDQRLMPRRDAEVALRGFLITMYDESRRPPQLAP